LRSAESDDTGALKQWFLTGDAPPQGDVNTLQRGAGSYVLCNMHSFINKLTNKYICLHNLFIVRAREIKAHTSKGRGREKVKNHCSEKYGQ